MINLCQGLCSNSGLREVVDVKTLSIRLILKSLQCIVHIKKRLEIFIARARMPMSLLILTSMNAALYSLNFATGLTENYGTRDDHFYLVDVERPVFEEDLLLPAPQHL